MLEITLHSAARAGVLLSLVAPLQLRAPGSLAGNWVMDRQRSTSAGAPLPLAVTYGIRQRGDTLFVERHTTGISGTLDYSTFVLLSGKPAPNKLAVLAGSPDGGTPERVEMSSTVTARWNHDTLMTTTVAAMHSMKLALTTWWWLSADGTTLTERRDFATDGTSSGTQVVVFHKR